MRLSRLFRLGLSCLTCGLGFVFPLQAATVTVNPGVKALTNAIIASSPGDVLELTNGTFEEGSMIIDKQLEIRNATGANPLVNITTANVTQGSGSLLLQITAAGVIWDGVDLNLNANDPAGNHTIRGIFITGETSTASNPVVIQNCNITDGPDAFEPGAWLLQASTTRYVKINNVNFLLDNGRLGNGIFAFHEPCVIELNNCDVQIRAAECIIGSESSATGSAPATIIASTTTLQSAGSTANATAFLFQSLASGDLVLNDSVVKIDNRIQYRGILLRLSNSSGTVTANRTFFDGTGTTSYMFNIENQDAAIDMTNCVVKYNGTQAPSCPFVIERGGTLRAIHCTITDYNPPPAGSRPIVYSDIAASGAIGRLEVKNCILDVPNNNTPAAYIFDQTGLGATNSAIVWDIGTNLISGTATQVQVPDEDRVTDGPVVEAAGATILQANQIDLVTGSPAIDGAPNLGVPVDFYNDVRPSGAAPDFGAVEFFSGPAPSAAQYWSLY